MSEGATSGCPVIHNSCGCLSLAHSISGASGNAFLLRSATPSGAIHYRIPRAAPGSLSRGWSPRSNVVATFGETPLATVEDTERRELARRDAFRRGGTLAQDLFSTSDPRERLLISEPATRSSSRLTVEGSRGGVDVTKDHGPGVKDDEQYEKLRQKGESKEKAARIANTGRSGAAKRGAESSSYEDWSKEDLQERAKELAVEGRSKMDKAELIGALRNH